MSLRGPAGPVAISGTREQGTGNREQTRSVAAIIDRHGYPAPTRHQGTGNSPLLCHCEGRNGPWQSPVPGNRERGTGNSPLCHCVARRARGNLRYQGTGNGEQGTALCVIARARRACGNLSAQAPHRCFPFIRCFRTTDHRITRKRKEKNPVVRACKQGADQSCSLFLRAPGERTFYRVKVPNAPGMV